MKTLETLCEKWYDAFAPDGCETSILMKDDKNIQMMGKLLPFQDVEEICMKLDAALAREKVLMDIVLGSRADLDAIDDYSKPLGCMERIDEALATYKIMKEEGK